MKSIFQIPGTGMARRRPTMMAVAIAVGLGLAGTVYAQATTGTIFGDAPAGAGESVLIQNRNGLNRTVPVDSRTGHYSAGSLPLGNYTVTLQKDGASVQSRENVTLTIGGGTNVSFGGVTNLGTLTVTASALPTIDISQYDSRTVVTAEQLAKLPLQRSAESVALLAPGVNAGNSAFTGPMGQSLDSFGGSSIAENAYYINGFNTTDPLHNFGGLTLPYGAIDQEQVLTGGYGAAYGRSDGGVISMVGKRGSNEWHFGGQVLWTPDFGQSSQVNTYFPTGSQYLSNANGGSQGQIYQYRRNNNQGSVYTYDAYVGGPLIKDKLFFFASVEAEHEPTNTYAGSVDSNKYYTQSYSNPKWYAKLDWNINDSNILELTGASNKSSYNGKVYQYIYSPGQSQGTVGNFLGGDTHTKNGADLWVAKYTGYITDALTVEALYGKMTQIAYSEVPGYDPSQVHIAGVVSQDPAYCTLCSGLQPITSINNPADHDNTSNYRVDLNYKIGSHSITGGIDNINTAAIDIGTVYSGPGYIWDYLKGSPTSPISSLPGNSVGAPGGNGYYVSKVVYTNSASAQVHQRAQYLQDAWQVNDRLLLTLGLRNDQFTNLNPANVPYVRLHSPQWAPRLGASWDVNGDSTFKVYGNAGRYYLAEPANVAIRGAAASTFTNQYFTYTGIDPTTGVPQGLVQIPQDRYPGVSANNEFGIPPNPREVTSKNAKAEYQDEYIAGFDKTLTMLGEPWVYGAKATLRVLRNDLDDYCDDGVIQDAAMAQGIDPVAALGSNGCYIINPGRTMQINVTDAAAPGGYQVLTIPWSATGMPALKRRYYALDSYLEHPFDGKWYGRIDYTFSRSYGNTEGSVRSDLGQTDVSQTEDWDNPGVMTYANGYQSNNHTHTLKARGYYQITPEWLVGANLLVQSGVPNTCLGYFGPTSIDPFGYANGYHFCNGQPSAPGTAGRAPWVEILSMNASYRPNWAGNKLGFSVTVYNLLDQQRALQLNPNHETGTGAYNDPTVLDPHYQLPTAYTTPRYVRFGVSYDF